MAPGAAPVDPAEVVEAALSTAVPPAAPEAAPVAPPVPIPVAPSSQVPAKSPEEAAPAPPTPAPPPDGREVDLANLPTEILSAWPNVVLSGHVWSEERELRLVVVEGRIVREGGDAGREVRLEEITPDGAVFLFHGYRVRVESP